jgi:hypothetical protein
MRVGLAPAAESLHSPQARSGSLDFPIPGRCHSHQRSQKGGRRPADLSDGCVISRLIRCRYSAEPGDLPHELRRCATHVVPGGRRVNIEQGLDITAHSNTSPSLTHSDKPTLVRQGNHVRAVRSDVTAPGRAVSTMSARYDSLDEILVCLVFVHGMDNKQGHREVRGVLYPMCATRAGRTN